MALSRVWIPSPCYNGRNVNGVRLIVLHTAEGARTIEDLGHFFQNYNNQVSSHVGADDKAGKIGEYVTRGNASWTCANYNPVAVQMELCGFASWTSSQWHNDHAKMLRNCADWIAEESAKLGIPITKLSAGQAQGSGRGVCQHRDLGAGGGGHTDCGNGFPIDYVLDMARGGSTQPTSEVLDVSDFLPNVNNVPLALSKAVKYVRFFCNSGSVDLTITFAPQGSHGANQTISTGPDNGPNGVNIPDGCNAIIIRRGSEPTGGYPLVSYGLQS